MCLMPYVPYVPYVPCVPYVPHAGRVSPAARARSLRHKGKLQEHYQLPAVVRQWVTLSFITAF